MRFSFSTNAFIRYTVSEAVERIALAGYEGVELLADTPHLFAHSTGERELSELGSLLARVGLRVANINANTAVGFYGRDFWEPLFEPSLAHPDPSLRRWRIDYTKRCLDMAVALNAPCISVTSGRMVPGEAPERSLEHLKVSLGEILDHAASLGVRVGIEYEPGLLIECYAELIRLLKELDSPHLGANLDLGHSHVLGEDPDEVIRGLGDRVFHIHLEDIRGRKHYHLIPGDGDMDIPRLLGLLRTNGYNGFVTVELYTYPHRPDEAAMQSLTYLKKDTT